MLAVHTFDLEEDSFETVEKIITAQGLFSKKQFITIERIWNLQKEEQEKLQTLLTKIPTDTIVCVAADLPPRKNNPLFLFLQQADSVEEYGDLNHAGLRTFITQQCSKNGSTIDSQAIALLIKEIGNDLWKLKNTIQSVSHYTNTITPKDVALFLEPTYDEIIFHLTDALGAKQSSRALTLLENHYAAGTSPQYILSMLAKHLYTLFIVRTNPHADLPFHPYVIEKAKKQGNSFSSSELQSLYTQLLDIDLAIKTTRTHPKALLEQCIYQACL